MLFQEKYCKMTGRPLDLGLRRKVFILMCILPVLIFSFEVIYQLTNGDDVWVDWWVAVKEWYLDVVRFFVVTFWHLTCGALSSAARNLWRNFRRVRCSRLQIPQLRHAGSKQVAAGCLSALGFGRHPVLT
jgi:hypothetical protein